MKVHSLFMRGHPFSTYAKFSEKLIFLMCITFSNKSSAVTHKGPL